MKRTYYTIDPITFDLVVSDKDYTGKAFQTADEAVSFNRKEMELMVGYGRAHRWKEWEEAAMARLEVFNAKHPTDANGNLLQAGIRVSSLDFDGETVFGTLIKSEVPETLGRWCIRYDDGHTYIVLDFDQVWKA